MISPNVKAQTEKVPREEQSPKNHDKFGKGVGLNK